MSSLRLLSSSLLLFYRRTFTFIIFLEFVYRTLYNEETQLCYLTLFISELAYLTKEVSHFSEDISVNCMIVIEFVQKKILLKSSRSSTSDLKEKRYDVCVY